MPKYSVLVAQFPYGGSTRQTVSDWLVRTVLTMKADPRIGEIRHASFNDTPITMTRNLACKTALDMGMDFVLMVDNDMAPDLPYKGARRFWDSSFDFAIAHHGPCLIGAPYCGPPPIENVYVFQWASKESGKPDVDFSLDQYSREDAGRRGGIEEVAALPTGLMLMHTEAIKRIDPPWFKYEYTDIYETAKATTEDVFFTRNLSLAGVPSYCNWDAWAGHWKNKCVGKPQLVAPDMVGRELAQALRRPAANERLVDVSVNGFPVDDSRDYLVAPLRTRSWRA